MPNALKRCVPTSAAPSPPRPSLSTDDAEVELARFMKGETKGLPNASHQGRIPAESYCKSEKHLLHAALASPNHRVASGHVDRITACCRKIGAAPHSAWPRDDLEEGLRTVPFEHSAVIAYRVGKAVETLNSFYDRRDYEVLYHNHEQEELARLIALLSLDLAGQAGLRDAYKCIRQARVYEVADANQAVRPRSRKRSGSCRPTGLRQASGCRKTSQ